MEKAHPCIEAAGEDVRVNCRGGASCTGRHDRKDIGQAVAVNLLTITIYSVDLPSLCYEDSGAKYGELLIVFGKVGQF